MEDAMTKGVDELASPSHLVVAIAVNGSRKTKYVVRWALDKFVPEGILLFKLFFIRPKITKIPTPMGSLPISQVRKDVAIAYKKEVEWQTYEQLLPFKNMCATRKVEVEIVQIESDDVAEAIKYEIKKNNIGKLVIGASSKGMFSRGQNLSARICESTPSFCTVYIVLKGILSSVRASYSETVEYSKDDTNSSFSTTITNSSSFASSSGTELGLLDPILGKSFIKNEFVPHAFDLDDIFYLEQANKPVSETHSQRPATRAQTRTESSRSSSPTEHIITEGISIKREREDSQDASEGQVLVRRRRRRSSTKKSTPKRDEAVIDQLARHLHGESYPHDMDNEVNSDSETSIFSELEYSDDDHSTPKSYAHESDIHVSEEESTEHETDQPYPLSKGKQLDIVNQTVTSLTPSSRWAVFNKHVELEKDSMNTHSDHIYHRRMSETELFDVIMTSQARMKIAMHELHHRSVETEPNKKGLYSKIHQLDKVALEVMSLRAKNKCWDMRNVIRSLEETDLGQVVAMAHVKMVEIACREVEEKLVKMKEALVEAQRQQYRLQLDQLQSHQQKQIKLNTNVETERARLQKANISTEAQIAIMKENMDSMTQQLLNNETDQATQIDELKGSIDILTKEKNWLITQGFSHFSEKIRSCSEMINVVAKMNKAANRVGYNEGIKAGYHYALEASIPIYEVPDLQANANDHLVEATKEFEQISFSCVAELAGMIGSPFEHIKSFIQTPYDR